MKKILGITFGGLQKKTMNLVMMMLLLSFAFFAAASLLEDRMFVKVVGETRTEQQQAISQSSGETMRAVLESSFVSATDMRARIADNDFSEVVRNVYMLQSVAQSLFESKDRLTRAAASLPDPAKEGSPSAMILCEEGVDYSASEYLGVAAHMSAPMLAMFRNSEKIDGC